MTTNKPSNPGSGTRSARSRRLWALLLSMTAVVAIAVVAWSGLSAARTVASPLADASASLTGEGPTTSGTTTAPAPGSDDAPASPAAPASEEAATTQQPSEAPGQADVVEPDSSAAGAAEEGSALPSSTEADAGEQGAPGEDAEALPPVGVLAPEVPAADVATKPGARQEQTLADAGAQTGAQAVGNTVVGDSAGSAPGSDRSTGLTPRGPIDPKDVEQDSLGALGGCLPEYGANGQCLPVVPPSMAEHAQQMTESGMSPLSMLHPWSCTEVTQFFPDGLAVRQQGVDPQKLDLDGDGMACAAGD